MTEAGENSNRENLILEAEATGIKDAADLRGFLVRIRDRLSDQGAPVYGLAAINWVMNLPNIYEILDQDNKELARDIWLCLKQAGLQVKSPPMLFDEDEGLV